MTAYTFPPRRILLPTDLSATSAPAFHFVRLLHEHFGGAVHVLHAQHFDLPPYFSSGQIQNLLREIRKAARSVTERLRRESADLLGFEAEVSLVETPPVEAILEAADRLEADLIVMGTHGRRGADHFWLGSVAERVLRRSRKPLLAVRGGMAADAIGHVLCPVGGGDAGRAALQYAAAAAEAGDLRLTVLHAVERGKEPTDCSLVPESVRTRCRVKEVTARGDAADSILAAAKELKPDLIIMGAETKTSAFGELFSRTTERVMRWTEVPLLVVPATAGQPDGIGASESSGGRRPGM